MDDKTHYTWVYFLKSKNEVFSKILEWKALVERMSDYQLKILRMDNGGEYTSMEFSDYLKAEGIRHEFTVPKTPEQNGVAKRLNRTLIESVRSMLVDAQLPHKFWAEALSTVVYLRNRSSTSTATGMTPFQAWSGKKPSVVDNLRAFGCAAYSHIPNDERKKLNPTARKCIFLGYGNVTKGYRLYDPVKARVIHSRDVIFDKMSLGLEKEQMKDLEEGISQLADVPVETNTDEPQDETEECDDSKVMKQEEEPITNQNEANPNESVEELPTLLRHSECT